MADPKLQRDDDDEPFDPDHRELCGDGLCVGVIGRDGRCKVCGKPGSGAPPAERPKTGDAAPAERGDWRPVTVPTADAADEGDDAPADEPAGGEPPAGGKPDFERTRVPCSDDMCTGIIGRGGRCGTCGKPWSGAE